MIRKIVKANVWAAVLLLAAGTACTQTSQLEEVELPVAIEETVGFPKVAVTKDTTLNLKVLYRPTNGCGRFSRADSLVAPLQTTLRLFVSYPADDQQAVCADLARPVAFTFRFKATAVGRHRFRFWQADNTYLEEYIDVK
ncbi:hypothetical protein [Rufibacter psychrotolerans]|uniref:hypothetical protein n=1 Tax=Rufibacter psychrotolerans TaxID=2812556 RepID=UPI0019677BB3|nr:hypothetical protein [Rufibacter sp. SYSU D00308]